jgi:hypothetical protein
VIILDTGGLYAALDASEPTHTASRAALLGARPPRALSPFVLAETEYLVRVRLGDAHARELLIDVERGAYRLEPFGAIDVGLARAVCERYADLDLGLADASVVVIAARHRSRDLLCTDHRHFRAVLALDGKPFRLLPADG